MESAVRRLLLSHPVRKFIAAARLFTISAGIFMAGAGLAHSTKCPLPQQRFLSCAVRTVLEHAWELACMVWELACMTDKS
jgi:hypothetical protein